MPDLHLLIYDRSLIIIIGQSVCLQHKLLDEVGNGLWGLILSLGVEMKGEGSPRGEGGSKRRGKSKRKGGGVCKGRGVQGVGSNLNIYNFGGPVFHNFLNVYKMAISNSKWQKMK